MKPEVLLECARKAYQNPKHPWFISGGWAIREDERLRQTYIYFDIKEGADQMALQIALEDDFEFTRGVKSSLEGKEGGRVFWATNKRTGQRLSAVTKPELLALCVEESMG